MRLKTPPIRIQILLALGALLAFSGPRAEAAKMTLGPSFVMNQASFGGDVPPEHRYEGTTGYGVGLNFDYYLKDDVAISIQPTYLQKGADLVWKRGEEELARTKIRSNYLSIPLAMKVTGNGRSRMYAHGGLQVDILLDAERTTERGSEDFSDGFESIEFGTSFGVGGLIALGKNYILVEGRYTQGLSNIAKEDLAASTETTSIKSTGMQLIVGFLFRLGEDGP